MVDLTTLTQSDLKEIAGRLGVSQSGNTEALIGRVQPILADAEALKGRSRNDLRRICTLLGISQSNTDTLDELAEKIASNNVLEVTVVNTGANSNGQDDGSNRSLVPWVLAGVFGLLFVVALFGVASLVTSDGREGFAMSVADAFSRNAPASEPEASVVPSEEDERIEELEQQLADIEATRVAELEAAVVSNANQATQAQLERDRIEARLEGQLERMEEDLEEAQQALAQVEEERTAMQQPDPTPVDNAREASDQVASNSELTIQNMPQESSTLIIDPLSVDDVKNVRQDLPSHVTFRDKVGTPGDPSTSVLIFGADYASVTLARAVPDDIFVAVTYHPEGGQVVDLLPLLQMTMVTTQTLPTMTANQRLVLESRGVNVNLAEGEELAQNMISVHLGAVTRGSYIAFAMVDDPELGVNNGGLAAVVADTDPMTVDLAGNPIQEPTFVPEGWVRTSAAVP